MKEAQTDQDRTSQLRRTTAVRRSVVAVGTVGALGTGLAIGVHQLAGSTSTDSTANQAGVAGHTTQGNQQPSREHGDEGEGSDEGQRQPRTNNQQPSQGGVQLAVPGNGGPAQAHSSGS